MGPQAFTAADFDHSPFIAFYEVTRACDLVCHHCRACAQPGRHPKELREDQSRALIDQFAAFPKPPLLVFTGGDPLKRDDVYDLVAYARQRGLAVAMTPSATPLVTRAALLRFKEMGLHRLAVSLDGEDAETHDAIRGAPAATSGRSRSSATPALSACRSRSTPRSPVAMSIRSTPSPTSPPRSGSISGRSSS